METCIKPIETKILNALLSASPGTTKNFWSTLNKNEPLKKIFSSEEALALFILESISNCLIL